MTFNIECHKAISSKQNCKKNRKKRKFTGHFIRHNLEQPHNCINKVCDTEIRVIFSLENIS
ncbi:hypothetical protein V6Z12_A07G183900 [Gossypium hirsutum]